MNIATSSLNTNGIPFSKKLLSKRTAYYDRVYSANLHILCDLGFTSNPSVFDESEFLLALKQSFPEDFNRFISYLDKRLDISLPVIEFVLKCSTREDFKNIVRYFYAIKLAEGAYEVFDRIYNNVKFQKRNDTIVFKPRFYSAPTVRDKSVAGLDNIYTSEVILGGDSKKLKTFDFHSFYYKRFAEDCGIEKDMIEKYERYNKGLFVKELTFEDEAKFVDLLLTGFITANGDFSKQYIQFHLGYFDAFYEVSTNSVSCQTYKDKLFGAVALDVLKATTDFRESLGDHYIKEFFVSSYSITFEVDSDYIGELDPALSWDRYTSVGAYALDVVAMEELSIDAMLQGYHGEFIKAVDVLLNDYSTFGLSIEINGVDYYPIHRVFYDSKSANLIHKVDNVVSLTYLDFDEVFTRLGVDSTVIQSIKDIPDDYGYSTGDVASFLLHVKACKDFGRALNCKSTYCNTLVVAKIAMECGNPCLAKNLADLAHIEKDKLLQESDLSIYANKFKFLLNKYNNYYEYIAPSSAEYETSEFKRICESIGVSLR